MGFVRQMMFATMTLGMALMAQAGLAQDFGPFVGGSVGTTRYDVCDQLFAAGATYCDDQDTGFKIFGGYKFNRYLAVEGGYVDFGKMYAYSTGPGVTTDVLVNAYYFSGIAAIPLMGRASLFGKVGGEFWEGEISGATPTGSPKATDSGTRASSRWPGWTNSPGWAAPLPTTPSNGARMTVWSRLSLA